MRVKKSSAGSASGAAFRYDEDRLHALWERLHGGDREPWPSAKGVSRTCAQSEAAAAWLAGYAGGADKVASRLRAAWREFHAGAFGAAVRQGTQLGPLGASVANKATAIEAVNARRGAAERLQALKSAIERGESAVQQIPDDANAHYMLALVLGRYSQGISVVKAVAAGLAGRVRAHLDRTLALEPRHAEAHVALGLYHAELIGKLGSMAAALTFGASKDAAQEHFKQALKLAPGSPIVHIEYAHGLMLLDASKHRATAEQLYAQAAEIEPLDAMEALDVARARRGLDS